MPTAFIATYGKSAPIIGILAEFDALQGTGNEVVPHKKPREDGVTAGQGCGHNLFGAASVGGAIVLKEIMEKNSLPGTIKLLGTPAIPRVCCSMGSLSEKFNFKIVQCPAGLIFHFGLGARVPVNDGIHIIKYTSLSHVNFANHSFFSRGAK